MTRTHRTRVPRRGPTNPGRRRKTLAAAVAQLADAICTINLERLTEDQLLEWTALVESVRRRHPWMRLSEAAFSKLHDRVEQQLPTELRAGFVKVTDQYVQDAEIQREAAFLIGFELGRRFAGTPGSQAVINEDAR